MWTTRQTRAQYAAITRLRWRMFLNGFRRKASSGSVLSTILIAPVALGILFALTAAAFALSLYCVHSGHPRWIGLIFAGIFVITLLLNINLGQPGTTFDPTQLIRFPLSASNYTTIRLFFGVLSPGNIAVFVTSLAAGAGAIVAQPSLWPWALAASFSFAITNILFTRMIFTWVERWLATRRAREIFTALIFIFGMLFQYWNINYNVGGNHHHHHHHQTESAADNNADNAASEAQTQAQLQRYRGLTRYSHVLDTLPPGLAGNAIAAGGQHRTAVAAAETLGTLAWGALFFAIFGLRMRTEFRGENLSDQANGVRTKKKPAQTPATATGSSLTPANLSAPHPAASPATSHTQPTREIVSALLSKEFLYMRRNTGLFYGMLAPLLIVLIFATARFARGVDHTWLFPGALAYALLGVLPINFNSFGLDGIGVQTYFLTPVRMRDVLLAKNIFNTGLAGVELIAILILVAFLGGFPPALMVVSVLLWVLATLLLELTVGNYQSLLAPKRVDPGRTAQKQARPLNALLSMGILLAMVALGCALVFLTQTWPELSWILPLSMLVFALISAAIYWHNLKGMDIYAIRHRDTLFEEMSRKV